MKIPFSNFKKILNESNYENIITYKGESQNWKVNYIDEYTEIFGRRIVRIKINTI
jgi:hypothetical protein